MDWLEQLNTNSKVKNQIQMSQNYSMFYILIKCREVVLQGNRLSLKWIIRRCFFIQNNILLGVYFILLFFKCIRLRCNEKFYHLVRLDQLSESN